MFSDSSSPQPLNLAPSARLSKATCLNVSAEDFDPSTLFRMCHPIPKVGRTIASRFFGPQTKVIALGIHGRASTSSGRAHRKELTLPNPSPGTYARAGVLNPISKKLLLIEFDKQFRVIRCMEWASIASSEVFKDATEYLLRQSWTQKPISRELEEWLTPCDTGSTVGNMMEIDDIALAQMRELEEAAADMMGRELSEGDAGMMEMDDIALAQRRELEEAVADMMGRELSEGDAGMM